MRFTIIACLILPLSLFSAEPLEYKATVLAWSNYRLPPGVVQFAKVSEPPQDGLWVIVNAAGGPIDALKITVRYQRQDGRWAMQTQYANLMPCATEDRAKLCRSANSIFKVGLVSSSSATVAIEPIEYRSIEEAQ